MNTGALIFAFNNQETDYVAMAVWSAQNIRRHLNIPTSIVTDRSIDHAVFDQVIVTSVAPLAAVPPEIVSPSALTQVVEITNVSAPAPLANVC